MTIFQGYILQYLPSVLNSVICLEIIEGQARALSSGEEKWELVVKSLRSIIDEVLALRNENANLKHSLHYAIGQIIKLDNQIVQYEEKLMEVEYNALQRNIVMYKVEEKQNQKCALAVETLVKTFKISKEEFKTPENPLSVIEVDTAY